MASSSLQFSTTLSSLIHPKSPSSSSSIKLSPKTLSFPLSFSLSKPYPFQLRTRFNRPQSINSLIVRAVRKLAELDPLPVSSEPGSEFPNGSGVYGVYDANGDLQFIGISRNIAASIATHKKLVPELCSSVKGTRLLDIRVQEGRLVCHGILTTYSVDVVIDDIKRFLSETQSELLILEIRTEFGHQDPPDFDKYLVDKLGEDILIHQDDLVFNKTVAEILPKRVICIWKPNKSPAPKAGDPLWNSAHLKDNWIDTDLPNTKFESNMKHLSEQAPVGKRKYFYRVENTVTPQPDNPIVCVKPVTGRIHGYARLFISQAFERGFGDKLQVFSTDFIDEDFVDACAGVTQARIEGKA